MKTWLRMRWLRSEIVRLEALSTPVLSEVRDDLVMEYLTELFELGGPNAVVGL